jgi:hypothetical protein
MLGMGGVLGAEVSFELGASGLDSDMLAELRAISPNNETGTLSFVGQAGPLLSPGSPPSLPLPSPSALPTPEPPSFHAHLIDEEDNQTELVEEEGRFTLRARFRSRTSRVRLIGQASRSG